MFAYNHNEMDAAYSTLSYILFYLKAFRRCHDVREQCLDLV